jgi:hypothetical protein
MVPVLFLIQGLKCSGVVWISLALDGTNGRDVLKAVMKVLIQKWGKLTS